MELQNDQQPLSGIRVLDLTHGVAGPYCTKLLADFGADVMKVERPVTGDYARSLGPFPEDDPHLETSGIFLHLNTNKRSVVLDLKASTDVEILKALVVDADILVENFRPGVMDDLGLGYDILSTINPDLVMTSISNFGQTGPYRDYLASEITLFAMGGRMGVSGLPDRYPLKLGGTHVQYQAGNAAAMATLAAWYGKTYTEMGGQHIDVSIFETQMGSINSRMIGLLNYQYNGGRGRRLGGTRMGYPSGYYPCLDGYVHVLGGGVYWPRTIAMLGREDLLEDPRYAPPMGQLSLEGMEEFENTVWLPWIMERTRQQIVEECQSYEILSGAINTIDDVVDHNPQADFRQYFVDAEHPVAGKQRYTGAPVMTEGHWWKLKTTAPTLGQHTHEIIGEARDVIDNDRSIAVSLTDLHEGTPKLPFEGIRVVDMTVIWAGPYSTMFLGDMGAEVVRVESLQALPATSRGQQARPDPAAEKIREVSMYPDRDPGVRAWNRSSGFNMHARNKYGMTADLRSTEGREAFRRLIEVSDIFIENNAAGAMARLGISYETVREWNPQLIMISAAGFGQTGPWSSYRGWGTHFEAMYGHSSVIGYPDMDAEGVPGSVASDASTGVTIAFAAIMALHHRRSTGKGLFIDISLGENFLPHLGEYVMDYTMNGRVGQTVGNRDHFSTAVQGMYQCSGDDEWIAISLHTAEQWKTLCGIMGRPDLASDPRYSTMTDLFARHNDIDEAIGLWTHDKDPVLLFSELQSIGIVAGPLLYEARAFDDPHLKERKFFVEITAPEVGTHLYTGTVFKAPKIPLIVKKPPVRLGEDNEYVYQQILKFSEEEYRSLESQGHIGMDYAAHVR